MEDSPADVRLTREALKEAKVLNALHVVQDGMAALAFLRKQGQYADSPRPDLILLDLNLPKKDGREVLAEIKQDEHLKRIPVVVLTTSRAEEDVVRSYDLHANAYVTKPVDLEQFLEVIRHLRRILAGRGDAAAQAEQRESRRPMKALLVEDNPADARLIREMLKEPPAGAFSSSTWTRLDSALERLRQEPFDVVLLDLGLPDSQGMETLTRAQKAGGGLPIVVLTGLDDESFRAGSRARRRAGLPRQRALRRRTARSDHPLRRRAQTGGRGNPPAERGLGAARGRAHGGTASGQRAASV